VAVQPPVVQVSFGRLPPGPLANGLSGREELSGKAEPLQRHGQGRQEKVFTAILKLAAVDQTKLCSLLQVYQIGARRSGLGPGRQRGRGRGRRSAGGSFSLLGLVLCVAHLAIELRPLVPELLFGNARLAVPWLTGLLPGISVRKFAGQ